MIKKDKIVSMDFIIYNEIENHHTNYIKFIQFITYHLSLVNLKVYECV